MRSVLYSIILILISIHGFNGLRVVLLELKQGSQFEKSVTYGCLAAMVLVILYGSRTIFLTTMGMI